MQLLLQDAMPCPRLPAATAHNSAQHGADSNSGCCVLTYDSRIGHLSHEQRYVLAWLSFVGPAVGLRVPACLPLHMQSVSRSPVQASSECA